MTIEDKKVGIELSNDSGNTSNTVETQESISNSFECSDSRNLIINYLPQHMNEQEVHALFSTIGEVESCKLVRSKDTKQSLGYAFVKYKNHDHAAEAVQKLNKISLGNKIIKVSFARPSKPEIKDANLYVGGLPSSTTQDDLRKLFGPYGEIITCRVVQAESSNDYYFGFVRFDTKNEATSAMEALHGKIPPKEIFPSAMNPLTVKFAKTPQSDNYGFPYDLFKSPKEELMKTYGRVHTQYIQSMANATEHEERLESQMSNRGYSDSIHMFSKNSSNCSCCNHSSGFNVVLTNLSADTSELILYRLCSKFGAINSVQVFFEENSWFAIINMFSQEEANNAANCLNGLLLQPYTPIKAEIY